MDNFIIYALIAIATIASPGPGVILSITNALTHGRIKATYGILGISTGMFVIAIISATSIGIIIATSHTMFLIAQSLGAVYLFYLGAKMLLNSRKSIAEDISDADKVKIVSNFNLFKQGLFTSLANPKPILFFMAVFPQFIDNSKGYINQFLILSLTFCLLVVLIHTCYSEVFAFANKHLIKAENKLSWITKIGGSVLMIVSLLLVANASYDYVNSNK